MLCLAQARADGVRPGSRLWESCCLFERFGALRSKRLSVCLPRRVISSRARLDALNVATMRLRPKPLASDSKTLAF